MKLRHLLILTLTSCTVSSGIKNSNQSKPYDYESTSLHVNTAASQTEIYVELSRSELLYTRDNPQSDFVSKITFNYLDQTISTTDTLKTDSPQSLRIKLPLTLADKSFKLETIDMNRKTSVKTVVTPRKYLVWNLEENWAVCGSSVSTGTEIEIKGSEEDVWYVRTVLPKEFLPSPPFTGGRDKFKAITDSLTGQCTGKWTVKEGSQRFVSGNSDGEFGLYGRNEEFPELLNVIDLIEATRYISTVSEYKNLISAEHPKQALDDFWMKCGDTPEKSRELIKIYYGRVEEANRYFSGLLEGWRTDRGMIHIVMGAPNRVNRDSWGEYWVYGDEASNNNLTFRFRRKQHPIDDNIFILERNSLYRMTWETFVTSWRNGRVYGD